MHTEQSRIQKRRNKTQNTGQNCKQNKTKENNMFIPKHSTPIQKQQSRSRIKQRTEDKDPQIRTTKAPKRQEEIKYTQINQHKGKQTRQK